jgi:Holliday junction resolvase RusA-like endonuclease
MGQSHSTEGITMTETPGFYETLKQQTLSLTVSGQVVPKARPRFKAGQGGFLPKRYRDWKQSAIAELLTQVHTIDGLPLSTAHVQVTIHGSRRGDLDNLCGAIFDALVQAGILKDDSVVCVPAMVLQHHPVPTSQAMTTIRLTPVNPVKEFKPYHNKSASIE